MPKFTNAIIEAAIHGFEAQKQEIDGQIAELRGMLTGTPQRADEGSSPEGVAPARKRRKFSAAARKRMREAQQARWAKSRGESAPEKKTAAKTKRIMSAAARKAIAEAQRKRWAAKRTSA